MKYLLTASLAAFFFSFTYASAPQEFAFSDLVCISGLLLAVLGIQFLIARVFARYSILQNLILACFSFVNIFAVNLVLNQGFWSLTFYGKVLALIVVIFIVFTFMNMLDERVPISRILPALLIVATVGVLVNALQTEASIPLVPAGPGKTSAENVRLVEFRQKPNVYFVSFDSMIPKTLLQKHLGLESTPYHDILDANFRPFRNFFADRVLTRRSLNSLLAFDIGHDIQAEQLHTQDKFFSGVIPSPLLEIFKHNGYETNTLYRSQYLGIRQGQYVDNYHFQGSAWDLQNGVCEFINVKGIHVLTFMGYCKLVKSPNFRDFVYELGFGPGDGQDEQIGFLIDNMRAGLEKARPQFFLAYIFSPGHTEVAFNGYNEKSVDAYRSAFIKGSEDTASHLNEIIRFIDQEDPEAIVYVFGDHGPMLSRRHPRSEDPAFVVQDRMGVYGGIYPGDRCAASFANPYSRDFVTILQGAHMIIRCLSGGENAFVSLGDYRLENKDLGRYEKYLYE